MNSHYFLALVAIVGGLAVSLQGQFMGQLDRQVGTMESVFITYGMGGILAGLIMIYMKGGNLTSSWNMVPWYTFTAGFLGLIIVGSIAYTVPRLGMASAFTLLLIGQFALAAVIDHFGLMGSEVKSIGLKQSSGLVLLMVGAVMVTT